MKTADINAFDAGLREACGSFDGRPFLCEGSPFGCDAFIVGINPGTDTPFWPYWTTESGCDKQKWLAAYLAQHGRYKPTRARIERIFAAAHPLRLLETNIFHAPSARESMLASERRTTRVFDYLLAALRPAVLFVHGRSAVDYLERVMGISLPLGAFTTGNYNGTGVDVLTGNHLSYQWSFAAVDELGLRLRERASRGTCPVH